MPPRLQCSKLERTLRSAQLESPRFTKMTTSAQTSTSSADAHADLGHVEPKMERPRAGGKGASSSAKGTAGLSGLSLYVSQWFKAPTQIGAISPSSQSLARTMIETVDFANAKSIIEFGPGPGNVTSLICQQLRPSSTFFAIEQNAQMCRIFREQFPKVKLFEGSAGDVGGYCEQMGVKPGTVDAIISGLPWAAFPQQLQDQIMSAAVRALRPGGHLVTFAYNSGVWLPRGRRFAKRLPGFFSRVEKSRTVWSNLPPAFTYRCYK
jgi:phosphatidylethanolamine/phosphatidyl-N-methylethanolamine N-methyltransferase